MTAKKTAANPKPQSLKVERIFDASPQTLWTYWTDPEKFARWFNPARGLDLVVHEYDVRVGGRVRFDMPEPGGRPNAQEGVFHVLKPHTEIVSGTPDKSFLIAVRFAAVGKRTRMTVTVTGVPTEHHVGAIRGWNAGFDKLGGLLATAPEIAGFTIERTFKAPLAKVWEFWTTKEGLERWWGPEGFTMKVHILELRPGGAFAYEMTATAPDQVEGLKALGVPLTTSAHNVFTDIVPRERLGFKTRMDFIPGVAPYDSTSRVEFHAVRGGTRVAVTLSKMHSEQWQELAREGWTSQFEKLARILEA